MSILQETFVKMMIPIPASETLFKVHTAALKLTRFHEGYTTT